MKEFCESGVDKRVSFLLEVFTRESFLDLNLIEKPKISTADHLRSRQSGPRF